MDELHSIVIERPVKEVFEFLADFENDIRWREELIRIQRQPEFPDGVGAHYVEEVHWEGRRLQVDLEVTKLELCRRIEFEGHDEGIRAAASFTFEPISEHATRLTAQAHFDTSGPLNVLEPFLRALVSHQVDHDLERLRALLEGCEERKPDFRFERDAQLRSR